MDKLLEAADLAKTAVKFDQDNCTDAAIYYYKEAAQLIKNVTSAVDPSSIGSWVEKAQEYLERAHILSLPKEERPVPAEKPELLKLKQCKFLFNHALDADEAGERDTALSLYTQAIEMCLQTKSETSDAEVKKKLQSVALKALERGEQLKGVSRSVVATSASSLTEEPPPPPAPRPATSRQVGHSEKGLRRGFSSHLVVCGNPSLSTEEKQVLLATSRINNIDYLPFMDIDLHEKFQFALPFSDKDGRLALSPEQKNKFSRWARPDELTSEPRLLIGAKPDYYSIRQTIISDCSFVASLAISALYEKKFNTSLITAIIYPKNRNSQPIYNPFGKYMVKLHLNGVTRKVIIDDLLPVGRHNELLCSFSTNQSELWISLLEKAYMKVMGGYDFPGSNSSIDLHALTGWIPDRQQIRAGQKDWPADEVFNRLLVGLHAGELLATVATGEMSEEEANRAGLVPTHAYAVLDARLLNGVQLLKLKNPWSHVRWKGHYSELDKEHWTPALQNALDYDPKSAKMFDNGVFWIDYNSIQRFFDVFYFNWNPKLFNFTSCIHQRWDGGVGPVKDSYTIGENPQYRLRVEPASIPVPSTGHHRVWVLLTRHITSIEDFRHNSEYITLLVYKNNGNRVYYPHDPPPYLDGERINSPHYVTKINLTDPKTNRFTLVMSQYKKTTTIYYTLRAYATCKFSLEKITDPYRHTKKVESDCWKGETAGGCRNHPSSYYANPTYRLVTESTADLLLELRAPKQFHVGLELSSPAPIEGFSTLSSAPYRCGYVVLTGSVPAGTYHVIPSTFSPGQESPYFLSVRSSQPFSLTRIQ